jgi:hypothetical protein
LSDVEIEDNMKHLQLGVWSIDTPSTQDYGFARGTWLGTPQNSLSTHIGNTLPGYMKHILMEMTAEQVEVKTFPRCLSLFARPQSPLSSPFNPLNSRISPR